MEEEKKEPRPEKGSADFKRHNGDVDLGAMLGTNDYGAKVYGAVLAAMSPPCLRRHRRGPNN
jgi:hypothetical protein